jgi:hypothetical protein
MRGFPSVARMPLVIGFIFSNARLGVSLLAGGGFHHDQTRRICGFHQQAGKLTSCPLLMRADDWFEPIAKEWSLLETVTHWNAPKAKKKADPSVMKVSADASSGTSSRDSEEGKKEIESVETKVEKPEDYLEQAAQEDEVEAEANGTRATEPEPVQQEYIPTILPPSEQEASVSCETTIPIVVAWLPDVQMREQYKFID